MINFAFGIIFFLLLASALFDLIAWKLNITALVLLAVVWVVVLYNQLVSMRNRVQEAWSDIEVQLKRRYDLIPNLVETVKGYMQHERETLERVTAQRAAAMQAGSLQEKAQAENMLTETLKSLFAVAEQYPDLKANQNFLELQRELSDTENKLQAARRFYNSVAQEYNTAAQSIPTNIVALLAGFTPSEYFELAEEERAAASQPVRVSFSASRGKENGADSSKEA
ncbi:LemA family protein [Candidatus Parcubacteria bacterium]|jgi:LemA protein|nr:MAG: LemA family protein [Candidatus Parcubacteria bacterium]